MKALCWHGTQNVSVDSVPDPKIQQPTDAIIRVTSTAICGSDLHLFNGYMPTMQSGDILGHEFMGEVIQVGSAVESLEVGDRVIVPFPIACGDCFFCRKGLTSCCDNSNPNAAMAKQMMGQSPSGIFGYSHLLGGYSGGQAELVRVPYADFGPFVVPDHLTDEQVLFLTDIFPTGYMAAENCAIEEGDTVAIWGCGPVGQFAIKSAWMFGAGRVIAIDTVPERLELARTKGPAETINFAEENVPERLKEMTDGRGPDRCIDAVGTESHVGATFDTVVDRAKEYVGMGTDRPHVLREAILSCRKGGVVSIPGVYIGYLDAIPMGAAMNKGLTMRMGQTHVHGYLPELLQAIEGGIVDPSYIITHRVKLDDAAEAYKTFADKSDGCIKVVMTP